jgi:thiol:disulfide interchange protein DsbD
MENVWQKFALKVGAWVAVALAVHFLTKIFLGAPPDFLVPAILAAGAVQIAFLDRTPLPAGNGKMLKRGVGLLMITFAVWIGTNAGASARGKIPWQSYSEEILEVARKSGRPVMIDFMSPRCPPCREMDRQVFSNDRVASAASQFIALRVDLTDGAASSQTASEKFGIQAMPTIVFLGADGKERSSLRLVGFENARFFAERLESAR